MVLYEKNNVDILIFLLFFIQSFVFKGKLDF